MPQALRTNKLLYWICQFFLATMSYRLDFNQLVIYAAMRVLYSIILNTIGGVYKTRERIHRGMLIRDY